MVNRGFSRGCERCRERHKACDSTRPACQRCLRQNVQCPGYRTTGDILFRPVAISNNSAINSASSSQTLICTSSDRGRLPGREDTLLVHKPHMSTLAMDTDAFCESFFFTSYAQVAENTTELRNGKYEGLLPLYNSCRPTAPFRLCMLHFAATITAVGLSQPDDSSWQLKTHNRALLAIKEILTQSYDDMEQDQAISAAVLLGAAEQLRSVRHDRLIPVAHYLGAAALVQRRGIKKARRPGVFRLVVDMTRRNLLMALPYCMSEADLDLITKTLIRLDYGDDIAIPPAVVMDRITCKAWRLKRIVFNHAFRTKPEWQTQFQLDVGNLQRGLDAWFDEIPPEWFPQKVKLKHWPRTDEAESYLSHDIAVSFNQARTTRILVLALEHSLANDKDPTLAEMRRETANQLAQGVLAAASYFIDELVVGSAAPQSAKFMSGPLLIQRLQYHQLLQTLLECLHDRWSRVSWLPVLEIPRETIAAIEAQMLTLKTYFQSTLQYS